MATLQKIRQKGALVTGAIFVALLAFLIGDMSFRSLSDNARQIVAEVNGEEIKIAEYEKLIDDASTFYKYQFRTSNLTDQQQEQIRTTVWNSWLAETLIAEQCDKLGIVVTDDEFTDAIVGEHPHPMLAQLPMFFNPEKGGFDRAVLLEFLKQVEDGSNEDLSKYWSFVQHALRSSMLAEKYNSLVAASFNVNDIDAKYAYDGRTNYDIEYVQIPYSTIADSTVSVSDKDIKAAYNEMKNSLERTAESRVVEIYQFPILPSTEDFEEVSAWIESLKEEFSTSDDFVSLSNQNSDVTYKGIAQSASNVDPDLKNFAFSGKAGDVFGPQLFGDTYKMARIVETGISGADSVKLSHILCYAGDAEKSQALADSLMNVLAKGADFGELAAEYSVAETRTSNGEIGWIVEGEMDEEMSDACFKAAVNKPFTYKTGNAVQIFKVTDKTKTVAKVKMCVLARKVDASARTYSAIFNEASSYIAKNDNLAAFEDSSSTISSYLRSYSVGKNDNRIAEIAGSRSIVRWAYEAKEGDVCDKVTECGDQFIIAALKSILKEGVPSMEEVDFQLRLKATANKKYDEIAADVNAKLAESDDLSRLGEVKSAEGINLNSSYIAGVGSEPAINGSLAALAASGKPAVFKCAGGVAVVKVVASAPVDGDFNAAIEAQQIAARRPYIYMLPQSLQDGAKIVDNRINFY